MTDSDVTHNEPANQFELREDGETAVLSYRLHPDSMTFVHTGVAKKLEGRGIAGKLAAAGLEYARQKKLTVIPLCPFVASYIKKHPEYLDLVREDHRARLIR